MSNPEYEKLAKDLLQNIFEKGKDPTFRFNTISKFSRHFMPQWFVPMLQDHARNKFYSEMLQHKVKDRIVVDLGAGTGMWSIESLARGAKFVYVVEQNPMLIGYLEFIFKDYPVKVIGKTFDKLTLADFDHGLPEVLVQELYSNTGIGEGIIPAFRIVANLFKDHKLEILPQHFWLEARVKKEKPLELSAIELNHLQDKKDAYFELIYSFGIRGWGDWEVLDFTGCPVTNVLTLDLDHIEPEKDYQLQAVPVDITPGFVHHIYLSFKFAAEPEGPFFDSALEKNHWGGFKVEFYASENLPAGRKYLKFKLRDNTLIDNPALVDEL